MRVNIPFGEQEESPREKCSFDEAKEETNQERASETAGDTGYGAVDIQIQADIGGTNAAHLITPQTTMHAGR